MEYRRFSNKIFARLDKGEEIISSLKKICQQENVRLATVSAIGAINFFNAGVYSVDEKFYRANDFTGEYEIVSLSGTVTIKEDNVFIHLHISVSDGEGKVIGGHLSKAIVSATCEMVIEVCDGIVERKFDEKTGLNIFYFKK